MQFDGLVGRFSLQGAGDVLQGGAGDDRLIGDHHVMVSGVVTGPVLSGSDGATGYTSDRVFETPVEFNRLVGSLEISRRRRHAFRR